MRVIITVAISVNADDEDAAERMLDAALDNLANNGGDIRGHEILETRQDNED